jgi:hypothetical protein
MSDAAVALRHRVRAELDPSLPVGAATVTVWTRSGETFEATVEPARGSIEKPLSDAELEAKVHELASWYLPQTDMAQLLDMLWQLQDMATIHPLMGLVSGRGEGASS